jgi:hypothetical protein
MEFATPDRVDLRSPSKIACQFRVNTLRLAFGGPVARRHVASDV